MRVDLLWYVERRSYDWHSTEQEYKDWLLLRETRITELITSVICQFKQLSHEHNFTLYIFGKV